MTDPRWEDDTLFLVFEEDFRFTEVSGAGLSEPAAGNPAPVLERVKLDYYNKEPILMSASTYLGRKRGQGTFCFWREVFRTFFYYDARGPTGCRSETCMDYANPFAAWTCLEAELLLAPPKNAMSLSCALKCFADATLSKCPHLLRSDTLGGRDVVRDPGEGSR